MPFLLHAASILTNLFVASLWQGLAFAALGVLLCALLSRAPASLRHSVLFALFVGTLLVPCLHFQRPAFLATEHGLQLAPWVSAGVAMLWLGAVLLRAGQIWLAWRHLCRVRRQAEPVQVQDIDSIDAGGRCIALFTSAEVNSPSILGFGSPRLLLPKWMVDDLSTSDLRQIALHEAEHLRRGDDWLNLAVQFGVMLSPLNPFLLWLGWRIAVERELAVDAAVVAHTNQPLTYAACLTRLAEQRLQRGRLRLALAAWGRRSELVRRVYVLLNRPSNWTRHQSAGAAVAVAVVVLLAAGAMACTPGVIAVQAGTAPLVAQQKTAGVTSGQFADRVQSHPEMASARFVPASFHVETVAPATLPAHPRRNEAPSHGLKAARLTLATAVLKRPSSHRKHASASTRDGSVRFVRAEFTPAYLALPTIDGWLLFQL